MADIRPDPTASAALQAVVDAANGPEPSRRFEQLAQTLDIERFIGALPNRLRCCCHWLTAENRRAAALAAGMHRSSLYQAARDLKQRAIEAGLDAYLAGASPTLSTSAR